MVGTVWSLLPRAGDRGFKKVSSQALHDLATTKPSHPLPLILLLTH